MTKLILAADIHLREDQPECRTDDFMSWQLKKLKWLKDLQSEHDCPVIIAGDLFHKWKVSPYFINTIIPLLPDQLYAVPGNHDLPTHSMDRVEECSFQTLVKTGIVRFRNRFKIDNTFNVNMFAFNQKEKGKISKILLNVAVVHEFLYKGAEPYPGARGDIYKKQKEFRKYDLVVSGDNHTTFKHQYKSTLFINPGSFFRQTADQINHKPCVFLYDSGVVSKIKTPSIKNAVTRDHLDEVEEKNLEMGWFISTLKDTKTVTVSFKDNIMEFMKRNKIKKLVKTKILEAME